MAAKKKAQLRGKQMPVSTLLPPGIERRRFTAEDKEGARNQVRSEYGWDNNNLVLLVGSGHYEFLSPKPTR